MSNRSATSRGASPELSYTRQVDARVFVQAKEIANARAIAAADSGRRHRMPTHANAIGNTIDRKVRGRQPKKQDLDQVSIAFELREPRRERAAGERCLEREADTLTRELTKPREHDAAGR